MHPPRRIFSPGPLSGRQSTGGRHLSGALIAWGGGVAATGQVLLAAPEIEALTLIVGAGIGAAVAWLYARARVTAGPT